MTRDNFLGFGCSAATLLRDQFKINTFSVEEYIRRIDQKKLPTALTLRFTPRQRMIYYLFWTAYSTRVDPRDFEAFFGVPLKKMYGLELRLARLLGFAEEKDLSLIHISLAAQVRDRDAAAAGGEGPVFHDHALAAGGGKAAVDQIGEGAF